MEKEITQESSDLTQLASSKESGSKESERGMTLVEVLAVIVLIALITAVIAPNIFAKSDAAKAQLNIVKMEKLSNALGQYNLQFNRYPDKLEGLISPSGNVKDSGQLFTPFVDKKELGDVWETPFIYKSENNGRSFSITSLGSDGVAGGTGPASDVKRGPGA